jgi:hypothetical protein
MPLVTLSELREAQGVFEENFERTHYDFHENVLLWMGLWCLEVLIKGDL